MTDLSGELQELTRETTSRPESVVAAEKLGKISELHEPVTICAECWTTWPCETHKMVTE